SQIAGQAPAIHTAEPARSPEEVVPRRPFFLQQRFRLSIPDLLLPIRSKVAATMVPDDRRGGIADDLSSVLEPPTNVDVVARGPESGVEPPTASRAPFRNAMLHPGICSAIRSEIRTAFGPPGAFAIASALHPSFDGARFGPPTAA